MDRSLQLKLLAIAAILIALFIGFRIFSKSDVAKKQAASTPTRPTFDIKSNEDNNLAIQKVKEDVVVQNGARQTGNISVQDGNVTIESNSTITGDIVVENGGLVIEDSVTVVGVIRATHGSVTIGNNNHIKADIAVKDGNFTCGNVNTFVNIIVENGTLTLEDINILEGGLINPTGKVEIGDINHINGSINAKEITKGNNNTIGD